MTHAIHEAIEGTNTTWTDDYRFRHADGTWAEILDRGILVRDTGGTARRMIGSMMDISERKRAERELRERADELLRLTSARERSNRDLDQFAYAASHDLKAPLRGISNLARGSRRSWVSPRRLRRGATWRSFAGASTAWRR